MVVSRNQLVLMYTASLIVGVMGVFFSYHTDITSSLAWIKWGNDQAWVGDSVRLISLYLLALLLITTSFRAGRRRDEQSFSLTFGIKNTTISLVFFLTVLILNFYYYPIYFEIELLRTTDTYLSLSDIELVRSNYFEQVYKPFFVYFFYSFSLWVGIILPTFLILVDGFFEDYKKANESIIKLPEYLLPCLNDLEKRKDGNNLSSFKQVVSDLGKRNQDVILKLRFLVQRYLPALLVVIIGYVVFNILLSDTAVGTNKELVQAQTPEAKSTFGWVIIIYLFIFGVFITMFAKVFNSYRYEIEEQIYSLNKFVSNNSLNYEFDDIVRSVTEKWDIRYKNVAVFIMQTLISSGSLSLPILITFAATISWAGISGYADELIPISIQNLIDEYFTRDIDKWATE